MPFPLPPNPPSCRVRYNYTLNKHFFHLVFQYVPFADHNAMLDPATVDITGRILECLATYGYDQSHRAVKKAIQFIRKDQEPDGSWFGRWGVNYIYGTMQVLRGLAQGRAIETS